MTSTYTILKYNNFLYTIDCFVCQNAIHRDAPLPVAIYFRSLLKALLLVPCRWHPLYDSSIAVNVASAVRVAWPDIITRTHARVESFHLKQCWHAQKIVAAGEARLLGLAECALAGEMCGVRRNVERPSTGIRAHNRRAVPGDAYVVKNIKPVGEMRAARFVRG